MTNFHGHSPQHFSLLQNSEGPVVEQQSCMTICMEIFDVFVEFIKSEVFTLNEHLKTEPVHEGLYLQTDRATNQVGILSKH